MENAKRALQNNNYAEGQVRSATVEGRAERGACGRKSWRAASAAAWSGPGRPRPSARSPRRHLAGCARSV